MGWNRFSEAVRRKAGRIPAHARQEIFFLVLLIIAAIVLIIHAGNIRVGGVQAGTIGPSAWPRAMLVGLIASCLCRIYERLRRAGGGPKKETEPGPEKPPGSEKKVVLTGMGLVIGYVFLSELVGFAFVSLLFLFAFVYLWGWRKKIALLVFSCLAWIIMLFSFVKWVYLPLPKGEWIFEDLTILLYQLLGIY